ncbi:uncharacterized protein B0P05DRAFT_529306 [Gilbertella persicaria]|uniref:uncharacterized protein n=1 Tax=Gilbertella persicaria TaxID=101096 RepID=UPI00221F9063|nr:uncharacterized protein B0P05DRAFT_529306 [Gilbertella persicaria]KAI8090090.1 hypothetical protein B0P05DRAFT_529306 [Gilbertella persicaria]
MARFIPYSVAMVTPFTKAGNLDIASVPAVVKYYLNQNVPGLLVSGTTGEQHCMTIAERKQLYDLVSTTVSGKCKLYAGVATFKTEDAKELALAAKEAGFSGIMLGFPPYRIPSQKEAELYVKEVADSVKELPLFLYNNPRRNGFSLEPETFARIAKTVGNIYGQKEAGSPENVRKMKATLDNVDTYSFFSGSDSTFIEAFTTHGYTGITSIAGNIYPDQMKFVVDHLLKNEIEQAKSIMESIAPGIKLLEEAGMIQSIKYILRKKDVPIGFCPSPIQDISDEAKQALDKVFFS